MDGSKLSAYRPLAVILLAATALQFVLLVRLPTISADGIIFTELARDLAASPIEAMRKQDQHPGFQAMLLGSTWVVKALGYRATPESWMAGGIIPSFVLGLLSVAVVWFFARDLFDSQVANVAALVFAVLPIPRASAVDAQSDTSHAFFYLVAAWMATTGLPSGNLWRLAAAGLVSGAAYWIRPEGLEVALVALPCLVWQSFAARWPWRRRIAAFAALAGTAFLVAAPYVVVSGKFTSKQLPGAIAKITRLQEDVATGTSQPAPAPSVMPEHRQTTPITLSLVGVALAALVNSLCQGFKFVFIPFYIFGNVALVWRRPAGIQIVFLALLGATHIAVLTALHVFSGYIAHRHVIPLVGLAMPFVGLGVVETGTWLARRLRASPAICTAAIVAASCAIVLPYTLRRLNREFLPVIEATRWIEARAEPDSGIVCNSPYVGFYGTHPIALLGPKAWTLDEALAEAPAARYDFAVIHVGAHEYRPEWLDELKASYHLVLELPGSHASKAQRILVFAAHEVRVGRAARESR
jgi:hypothetical protein